MSTEELIDQRLTDAGQRWRAEHPTPAGVDLAAPAGHRRGRTAGAVIAGIAVAAAVVVGVALAGHRTARPAPSAVGEAALLGKHWSIVQVVDAAGHTTVPAISAFVMFGQEAGAVTANDGCNTLSGPFSVHGGQVSISPLTSTAIGCLSGDAGTVNSILSASMSWSIEGDQLTLTGADGTLVAREAGTPAPTTDPKALVGTWTLTGVVSPDGTTTSSPVRPASVTFDGRGHLSGSDGCNAVSGPVTVRAGKLDVGQLGMTYVACAGTVNAESSAFDSILGRGVTWVVHGPQLTVSKDGAGALVFTATAAPAVPTTSTSSSAAR
jgi:heat shock protein HslJ